MPGQATTAHSDLARPHEYSLLLDPLEIPSGVLRSENGTSAVRIRPAHGSGHVRLPWPSIAITKSASLPNLARAARRKMAKANSHFLKASAIALSNISPALLPIHREIKSHLFPLLGHFLTIFVEVHVLIDVIDPGSRDEMVMPGMGGIISLR